MTLQEILASILNPNAGQQNQLSMAGGPTPVGDHHDPAVLWQAQQRLAQPQAMRAPQMPQQAQPEPATPPQLRQGAPAPESAPQRVPEANGGGFGGIGDFLQNIIAPQSANRNVTIGWLQKQGLDQGTATLLAGSKPALQQYLLQRSQGKKPIEINGRLVDPDTYQVLADFSDKSAQGFTLGEGQVRYDAQGNKVAEGGPKAETKPAGIQEYEYAKAQGFPGTFSDWEASKKGGMSLQVDPETGAVSFQQGGNIKPMTEGQSKDTTYAVRAEGALPILDQYGNALTNFPERAAGALPGGVGNYLQSPEYQQAQQAGTEFLQAILRKDTGAAITAQETAEYGKVYLPRPGDSPETLTQKQMSRKRALEALKAGMTPQAIVAQEKALQRTAGGSKKQPVVIDGYTIEEVD
ncbi:MAG: hypothetical protein EOR04_19620 [Mesorhizobium sp.]|uniref:hypothetical protein n=1 Tax=Mesorhizobium sp. TaxID=1871066 RepID=UPI000FE7C6F5|nr:hypothetical protein [Mesorhizobium sp.]RWP40157.1 MAG: hypothetical protein EOR04_19620 [Mesorhizobium sp.]